MDILEGGKIEAEKQMSHISALFAKNVKELQRDPSPIVSIYQRDLERIAKFASDYEDLVTKEEFSSIFALATKNWTTESQFRKHIQHLSSIKLKADQLEPPF